MQDGSTRQDELAAFAAAVREQVGTVILGKPEAVDLLIVTALCRGHALIEDVPGTGKTMLARAYAAALGLDFHRLQCTPDLLPGEVTGVNVFDQRAGAFEFRPGPVFSNVLLVDEINRATPRTQSALLEAMAEEQVSVDGVTHRLPVPFLVLATQNPVEHAGTFPLPEAQLDRFLMRIDVGYPDAEHEAAVLRAARGAHPVTRVRPVAAEADLETLWAAVQEVHVDDSVERWLVELVRATREHEAVALGASVRGSLALYRAAQARAAIAGRDYVVPDDVVALAVPVLAHRLLLSPESQVKGRSGRDVVVEVVGAAGVPVGDETFEDAGR